MKEMEWLRRRAAHEEPWDCSYNEVVTDKGDHVATVREKGMAEYIARLNNFILPITNLVLMLQAKLADRAAVKGDMDE